MVRLVVFICWSGLLFLFTCTESMEQFVQQGIINFSWSPQPNFYEFLYPLPTSPDTAFISRKMGHALSFFILSLLSFSLFLSIRKMLTISLLYAVITEVLQLFFHRGGRLFDIGFDGIGILGALIIVTSFKVINKRQFSQ
jgi:VanZ family protein